MNNWLADFAYRIYLGWQIFVLVGLLALGITLLTVSIRVIKLSMTNPADVLKYE